MKHHFALSEAESSTQFQRVSKDLLTHNAQQGVNYWGGSEYPAMLIWTGRIYDFLLTLEKVVGYYPARRHSYVVGYKSGRDGAKVNAQFAHDVAEAQRRIHLMAVCGQILAGAGWGRCMADFDDASNTVRWTFPAGTAVALAALQEGARKRPACPFVAGYLAGWTNEALGMQIEVQEVECVGRGDPRCVFETVTYLRPKPEYVEG